MPPDRWRQIEDIFHAALEREPAQRPAFLENACGGDEALRGEVEALLRQDARDGELLSQPIEKVADEVLGGGPSEVSLSPGSMAGPYRIGERIGAGGMGEVYRAQDTRLNRTVAIKTLKARFTERFQREARAISALNHPHICTLYDIGSQDGIGYLVMEYVEGEPLKGPLPVEEALRLAIQMAGALAAAHDKGILHRDLKPGNILLSKGGVKLLDFGLAKFVPTFVATGTRPAEVTVTAPLTVTGQILGTLAYMSPEQIEGKPADARSDIFSFGLVLYEMLTGRRAFEAASQTGLMAAILKDEPPPLTTLQPSIPAALDRTVRKCLAKHPAKRWQTAGDLRDELAWIAEGDVRPLPPATRLWPWAAVVLATVFAVSAAAGWWRANRSAPPHPLMRLSAEMGPDIKPERPLAGNFLALSPDGTVLAVIVRGADGQTRLATRRLDQSRTTSLAGTEGAASPLFSPDGQWIAFNADRKIKKISAGGGAAVTLCDAPNHMTGSWGDDGNIVAPLGWGTGLSRIPSAGGTPAPVTELNPEKGERRHFWPQVLPGSRAVLFTIQHAAETFDDADIDVVSLETGKRTTLHHGGFFARYLPSGHLVWVHQNTLYAAPFDLGRLALTGEPQPVVEDIYNGMDTGGDFGFPQTGIFVYGSGKGELQRSVFWLDSTGKTRPLHPAPGLYGSPRFSPDGKRLAFSAGDGQSHEDIWVRDLERDTASRVTLLPGQNVWPVWMPDGKNLVFWSSNPAAPGIYSIRADGSGAAQRLTDGKAWQLPQSISPDGKRLAMTQTSTRGGVEIWTAPVEDDAGHFRLGRAEPFLQTPFVTILPAFSPDGRWLAYYSGEPGKEGLWVAPFPGPGGGWLISSRGGDPIWSRSGRELFFLADSRTIMVAGYTARGDAFVFGQPRVWTQHPLLDLGSPPVGAYDLAPDGKRFAVVLNADGTADPKPVTHLTFLLNFSDELRRRVPTGGK
jgi:serine/threonine protein kinase/Tol biopolymer transport system component